MILQGEDRWDSGPEEGGLAKSHAARLLSELAGYERLHPLLIHTGAAQALAERGQELVSACCKDTLQLSPVWGLHCRKSVNAEVNNCILNAAAASSLQ